jgi:hypothetical protein
MPTIQGVFLKCRFFFQVKRYALAVLYVVVIVFYKNKKQTRMRGLAWWFTSVISPTLVVDMGRNMI